MQLGPAQATLGTSSSIPSLKDKLGGGAGLHRQCPRPEGWSIRVRRWGSVGWAWVAGAPPKTGNHIGPPSYGSATPFS